MDLRTDYPFWLLDKGILGSYPTLEKDMTTEVAIIGAGISGALIARQLCNAGIRCVMVDRRHVGMGSTAATTGLLQYETDLPLAELAAKVGYKNACDSYLLCSRAIDELAKLGRPYRHAEFASRPSFQYASFKKDVSVLKKEYTLRKDLGLKLDWLDGADIKSLYGFDKAAGLLSKQGAEVNAYGLTHGILAACCKMGMEIYDHTNIAAIHHQRNSVQLITTGKYRIRARKVIIACGYESGAWLPKRIDTLYTTYAIISEPVPENIGWHERSLIWETARPYLYLRTTGHHRILIGGKDDDFSSARKRAAALPRKVKELEKAFSQLFPQIPFTTDFRWAGLFAGTKDGLPYIGALPQRKQVYFALGFGGNGIVFSQIAATLLRDQLTGRPNKQAAIFRFDR